MTSGKLGWVLAVIAGAQAVTASGDFVELVPPGAARWIQLGVGFVGVVVAAYTGRVATLPADNVPYVPRKAVRR